MPGTTLDYGIKGNQDKIAALKELMVLCSDVFRRLSPSNISFWRTAVFVNLAYQRDRYFEKEKKSLLNK